MPEIPANFYQSYLRDPNAAANSADQFRQANEINLNTMQYYFPELNQGKNAQDEYNKAMGGTSGQTASGAAFGGSNGGAPYIPPPVAQPAYAAPTPAPAPSGPVFGGSPTQRANLGMGNTVNRAAVMPNEYNPGNTVNRAAVMPPENTGQRGMQPYNPAGMPDNRGMSRPGGGGYEAYAAERQRQLDAGRSQREGAIFNPPPSQRPVLQPGEVDRMYSINDGPGGGMQQYDTGEYKTGMGQLDAIGQRGNQFSRSDAMQEQRGMQQYDTGEYKTGMGQLDAIGQRGNQFSSPEDYNPGMDAQGKNPYLNQMASGMTGQVQQNFLQQTMPQLRSGAQAAGQYGGSRQGIAEGVAAGNAATGLAGQLANLYGGAYNTDQANQTQRYGTDVGAGVSMRGQDQNYNLGQGQLSLGYQNSNNSFNLGRMNNQTTQRGQDQNYNLGQGQLNLGYQNAANTYNLGQGQLNLGYQNAANTYNLGLGQLNLGQQQANNNYNLGLGQLDLSNQGQNQNFYTSQRGQDLQQYQLGANLYGNGVNGQIGVGQGQYNVGQQYQNAPINAVNQYGQAISPYTGYGQTQTTSGQAGGGANGVVGGGLAGAQIANNLWRGNQGNQAMINGGGFSNFPAYMLQN